MSTIRYPGTTNEPNADRYGAENSADYAPDRSQGNYASSARDYAAANEYQGNRGNQIRDYGQDRYRGEQRYGQSYGDQYRGQFQGNQAQGEPYRGSYAHDGHRFEDVGRYRGYEDDNRRGGRSSNTGYGRQPQGYDYNDRGFVARAGDEVRSWFGDDEAERRRELDTRYDDSRSADDHNNYNSWRSTQIAGLDRDYDEYRRENQAKFHNEFQTWRTDRQGQRDSLTKVEEHMDVVGSDGEHVGTVDKVRGDQILLTKSDKDAGGKHHIIPSRWIQTVDTKVMLRKSAAEAKLEWRDADRSDASSQFGDRGANQDGPRDSQGRVLGRSFSGTY